jgi:hypothetical protein
VPSWYNPELTSMIHINFYHCGSFHWINYIFQTERSFQKQDAVFMNKKSALLSAKGKKNLRYSKSVGLGFKTPREVKKIELLFSGFKQF